MKVLTANWIDCSHSLKRKPPVAKFLTRPLRFLLGIALGFYRAHISCHLVGCCNFHPSCSRYAEQALKNAPLQEALPAIAWRLLRCHPLSKGGWDPFLGTKKGVSINE